MKTITLVGWGTNKINGLLCVITDTQILFKEADS